MNLKQSLAVALRKDLAPRGFKAARSGRFVFVDPGSACVVELQQSSKSTNREGLYTLNVGVWLYLLSEELGGPLSLDDVSAMDCQWWVRAGQLDGGSVEKWWTVRSDADVPGVSQAMVNDFLNEALALALPLVSPENFKNACIAGALPFMDEIQRWTFVITLGNRAGDRDALDRAARELDTIGARRTLPAATKRLLSNIARSA